MGIERDRVFYADFEEGETETSFVNLVPGNVVQQGDVFNIKRNSKIDPLFGKSYLDMDVVNIDKSVDFTNPQDVRPLNNRTFDIRFAIYIPTSAPDSGNQFMGEVGTESWFIEAQSEAADDAINFIVTQGGLVRTFAFSYGVAGFARDTWIRFRLTYDKVTMRCYKDGARLGTGVTKASVMTGDWDDADGTEFRIGRFVGDVPTLLMDHLLIERGAPSVLTSASYALENESFAKEAPVLPVAHSQGSGSGPGFKTDVLQISSGHELRETPNERNRNSFTVNLTNKTQLELESFIKLVHICRGRGRIYRFKDWLEFTTTTPDGTITISDQTIGTGDGTQTAFQLTKTFFKDTGKSNIDNIRTISRPVPGTVRLSIDDVETFAFRIDHGIGKIFFDTAPLQGEVIKWGGEYDIPCRFNNDDIRLNMKAFENGDSNFDLIEVLNG